MKVCSRKLRALPYRLAPRDRRLCSIVDFYMLVLSYFLFVVPIVNSVQ